MRAKKNTVSTVGPWVPGTIMRRIATSVHATAAVDTRFAYSLGGGEGTARGLLSMRVCLKGTNLELSDRFEAVSGFVFSLEYLRTWF